MPRRPGPLGPCQDAELVEHIRLQILASRFHGEGYRKIRARLRHAGIRASARRVRRLMGAHGLLAPHRVGRLRTRAHDGTIVTETVNVMWGTDMTETITVAKGVARHFGGIGPGVAAGLTLRHDHGSNCMSGDFQAEIKCLGITSSPSFVREPEGNGVAERFIRTLKENVLWVHTFDTVEDLRRAPFSRVFSSRSARFSSSSAAYGPEARPSDASGPPGKRIEIGNGRWRHDRGEERSLLPQQRVTRPRCSHVRPF